MESRRSHQVSITAVAITLLTASLAFAQEQAEKLPPYEHAPTVEVYTNPDAAVVEASTAGGVPGATPTKITGRRKCHLEPSTNVGQGTSKLWSEHPNDMLYSIYCDGEHVGFTWRPIDPDRPPGPTPPREVAMHLREEIPMPQVTIRVNPETGLVGTESWFWVEGYGGAPITESTDAFGQLVEVEASVDRYEWSFGDGKTQRSSSLGRPYPERSEVRHLYERSSAGLADGYQVQVRFLFSVRYRVAGGEWSQLPGITRTASFRYPVKESQAVISR